MLFALIFGCTAAPTDPTAPVEPPPTEPSPPMPVGETEPDGQRPITLRLPPDEVADLRLDLGRDDVEALLGPIADDLVLLDLDPDVMLHDALDRIRDACGTDWHRADPRYDCTLTAIGRALGPSWQQTPGFAMVRLLTMTPGNADVTGTSLERIADLADLLGVGGGFGPVLSDTLDKDPYEPAVGTDALVQAIREDLLASHPNTTADGRLPVTLADALTDLATLGATLGPAGAHPGIVDPAELPYGRVLADDFAMGLTLRSNLRVLDGLDLSVGKGYLVTSIAEDPVELDFLDPDAFEIRGLVDRPTVDLRMALTEAPTRSIACSGDDACWGNLPGAPATADSVWQLEPHTLEYVMADAARREHAGRVFERTYTFLGFIPAVTVGLGQGGAPGGYLSFDVLADLGDPPDEQYIWELLLEVAQQNLHVSDTYDLPEGSANPTFSLTELPTGLSAVDTEQAVREGMQAEASTIAHALFGDYRKNSDPVDLIFARDADGTPALQFVAPLDRTATGEPTHTTVGLFSDHALTDRISTGSGGREVWVPPAGTSTVYAQDDEGRRYRIVVHAERDGAETVEVTVEEIEAQQ